MREACFGCRRAPLFFFGRQWDDDALGHVDHLAAIALLLCIAFQPFPTSVLGAFSTTPAVTFYAATLVGTGVVVLLLWVYATHDRRLVSPHLDRRFIQHHTLRAASVPLVFLISIGIAQVNPSAAELSSLSDAVFWLPHAR